MPTITYESPITTRLAPLMAMDAAITPRFRRYGRDEENAVTALQRYIAEHVSNPDELAVGHRLIESLLRDIRRQDDEDKEQRERKRLADLGRQLEERQRAATEKEIETMTSIDQAMDGLKADMKAAWQAREDVRPVIGSVGMGMDASEIYKLALDHLRIDVPPDLHKSAYASLFRASLRARRQQDGGSSAMALDASASAGLVEMFPNLARIRHA